MNSQEPGFFWPLRAGAGATRKKIPGAGFGAAWEKNQEPKPEPQKKLPAPQPWKTPYTLSGRTTKSVGRVKFKPP